MKVSGFSIIRDGVRFGYPFLQSIQSVLPLVDEFILAVGKSSDHTLEQARSLQSSKLRIIETEWDENLRKGGQVMSQQTNLALDECKGDWCIYIQGDEVFHEQDYPSIQLAMERHFGNRRIEGLSFRYRHFYGSYRLVNPLPYRRQIRIVRNGIGVRSVGDACGFALPNRKLRSKRSGAKVYHYGWVRDPAIMAEKVVEFTGLYHESSVRCDSKTESSIDSEDSYDYKTSACLPFKETHPAVMQAVIATQDWPEPNYRYVPLWRNHYWWNGFLKKNFATLYRLLPQDRCTKTCMTHPINNKRAA